MAAVRVLFGELYHSSPHRIEMDVPYELCQVGLALTQYRLITALENMSHVLVPAVIVLAVAGQKPLHCASERLGLPLDQQVYVVGDQAISVKKKWARLLCSTIVRGT